MRIDELNIPKSVVRNTENAYSKNQDHSRFIDRRDVLNDMMNKNGWRVLGTGFYSSVFENPKKSYVLKINHQSDLGFQHYVELIKANKNRHFPKISDVKIVVLGGRKYHVYLMEKLITGTAASNAYHMIKRLDYGTNSTEESIKVNKYFEHNKELLKAVRLIRKNRETFHVDIHDENVMQRKNGTVVISDPYS